jgi:hypothetical protein
MPLDSDDVNMIQTEAKMIELKIDASNNHLNQINKTLYILLQEMVKTNYYLEKLATERSPYQKMGPG